MRGKFLGRTGLNHADKADWFVVRPGDFPRAVALVVGSQCHAISLIHLEPFSSRRTQPSFVTVGLMSSLLCAFLIRYSLGLTNHGLPVDRPLGGNVVMLVVWEEEIRRLVSSTNPAMQHERRDRSTRKQALSPRLPGRMRLVLEVHSIVTSRLASPSTWSMSNDKQRSNLVRFAMATLWI